MDQEKKLRDEVETVWKYTYICGNVSAGGGCKVAVSARTRCWWAMLRECGEL